MTKYNKRTVSVTELAGDLASVIAEVERGNTVVVTRHGMPVAHMVPIEGALSVQEEGARYGSSTVDLPIASPAMSRLVSGPATRAVMSVFLREPAAVLHQREVARRANVGLRSAQIALKKLENLGLLRTQRDGNRLDYSVIRSERFDELQRLMSREFGIAEVIARHLKAGNLPIERAFIFGSIAAGEDTVTSDVDLLVVSDASADDLVAPIAEAQRELGREIDLVHYRIADFERRGDEGNHFIEAVLAQPRIDVIGSDDGS